VYQVGINKGIILRCTAYQISRAKDVGININVEKDKVSGTNEKNKKKWNIGK